MTRAEIYIMSFVQLIGLLFISAAFADVRVKLGKLNERVESVTADVGRLEQAKKPKPTREPELAKALTKCQEQRANWESVARKNK